MKRKAGMKVLIVLLLTAGSFTMVNAQDMSEATEAFNKALELQTSDPEAAITSLNTVLSICEQLGEAGEDLKVRAELKLPELYYNVGNKHVKDKKINAAIPAYEEAVRIAKKYGTPEVEKKAMNMLPQLHNAIGGNFYKNDKFDEALKALDQAIEVDPDFAKAYYTKSLVYKKLDQLDELEKTVDQGLIAAENSRDNNTMKLISRVGSTTFLAEGVKLLTGGKPADAETLLLKSAKYDQTSADLFYYLATAQNDTKQWDKAVASANSGIAIEADDPDKKAKHYYALGMALKGKGDKDGACAVFNNALFGQMKESAQYEIEHGLECNK